MIIFDVAISFAGEDRKTAKQLANSLKKKGVTVFYDYDFQSQLVGKDLYQHLYKIYNENALFFVPIISKNYVEKHWAMHELRAAQEREFNDDEEYILPIKLDDTKAPAIPNTKGYLDLRNLPINKIAAIIYQKVIDRKNDVLFTKRKLYNNIMNSTEFLMNRFCLLSQTSKIAEFAHLPALINQFKNIIEELNRKNSNEFYSILIELFEQMGIDDNEHINGLDDGSIHLKQINLLMFFYQLKEAYISFTACKYNDNFDFMYYIEYQNNNFYDKDELLAKVLSNHAELIKQEIIEPMTANKLYQECLKIILINRDVDLNNDELNILLDNFPKDLLNDYENSKRINQDAFEEIKRKIIEDENNNS